MRYVLWGLTDLHDDGVDSREFKYFIQKTTKEKQQKTTQWEQKVAL